jgi:hypothetical protein
MKIARIAAVVAATGLATSVMAQSGTLSTAPPNNGSGGVFMDLTNVGLPLNITGFDVAYSGTAGTAVDVEVWVRSGTYVGFDADPTGWTLTQTVPGIRGSSTTELTPLDLSTPILIDGLTAVYLHAVGPGTGGIRYSGTGTSPPQTMWSNGDLELFSDVSRTGSTPFGGSRFTPRTFAGNIHYDIIPAPASLALLGLGGLAATRRRR